RSDGWRVAGGWVGGYCLDDNRGLHLGAEVVNGTLSADRLRSRGGGRLSPGFAVLRIRVRAGGAGWRAAGGGAGDDRARRLLAGCRSRLRRLDAPRKRSRGPGLIHTGGEARSWL
ncbi:MAG: hypothetical protein MUF54_26240, partial [Polyangiaceae bacterium]|nr:hypothetical protein [Polyangiaceae bacterium]